MELREIAPHVHACIVEDRGWCWSNAGCISAGEGLMVDTFADVARTRAALGRLSEVGVTKPRQLMNTHHNLDHCWGNQLFRDDEIIGHRKCAEAMATDLTPAAIQAMLGANDPSPGVAWFAGDVRGEFDFAEVEITPPNRIIDGDLTLDVGGIQVELLYVGPAHTGGDLIAHLPAESVVFAGDILFHQCTPIGWEGTFEGWMRALDRIVALDPETVVPGHGPLCGPEGARELRDYFAFVWDKARDAFKRGASEAEAVAGIELGPFARWTQPERIVFNVHRAYRELSGGAIDAPVPAIELMDRAVAWREARA